MKFKKEKNEVFIGNLRVSVDSNTQENLKGHELVKRRLVNGVFFFHYRNGTIEIKSQGEVMKEMCEEIQRRT